MEKPQDSKSSSRRRAIKQMLALPIVGGHVASELGKSGWKSHEQIALERRLAAGTSVAGSVRRVPSGKIKDLALSRLSFGGNLIGGWAHARDLLYANELVKAYHTMDKVMEMYAIGEANGITGAFLDITCMDRCEEYHRRGGSAMRFVAQCPRRRLKTWDEYRESLQMAVDAGASLAYVQGAEQFIDEGDADLVSNALEFLRGNGLVAGIGSHHVGTIRKCVEMGFEPDFWMKTLHHHDYWSAMPDRERHDNLYCEKPDETIAYMQTVEQPWVAFKILAAGAIHPNEAFSYAFDNGADFICVGMYDFQIAEDAELTIAAVEGAAERRRPWRA